MSTSLSDSHYTNPNLLHEHFNRSYETENAETVQKRRLAEGIFGEIVVNPEYDLEDAQTLFTQYKNRFPNFAPEAEVVLANVEEMLQRYEHAQQNLSDKGTSRDLARLLTIALIELAAQQRKDALDNRINARTAAKGELLAQSADLIESADETRGATNSQAVTTIVFSAVGGLFLAGSTAMSMKNAKSLKDLSSQAPKAPKAPEPLGAKAGFEDMKFPDMAKQSSSSNPISDIPSAPARSDVDLDLDAPANVKADAPESRVPSPSRSQDAENGVGEVEGRDYVEVEVEVEEVAQASRRPRPPEDIVPSSAKPRQAMDDANVKPELGEADAPGGVKTNPAAEGQKPPENAVGKKTDQELQAELMEFEQKKMKSKQEEMKFRQEEMEFQRESKIHGAEVEDVSRRNGKAQAMNAGAQMMTTVGNGAAGLAAKDQTHAAKTADSEAAKHAAEAEEIKGEGDVSREIYNGLAEHIKSNAEFLKELNQSENEEWRAVTSRGA